MRKLIVLLALLALLTGCGALSRTGEVHDVLTAFGQATGTNVRLSSFHPARITMYFPRGTSNEQILQCLQEITAAIEAAEGVPDADE